MSDFTIKNKNYRAHKLSPFKQFHIVRRIGPILSDLAPVAMKYMGDQKSGNLSESQAFEAITPIMNGLSKLSDADADYVMMGLLSGVQLQQEPSKMWAHLVSGDKLMFADLDLQEMIQIAGRSFAFNLSGFFTALPSASADGG